MNKDVLPSEWCRPFHPALKYFGFVSRKSGFNELIKAKFIRPAEFIRNKRLFTFREINIYLNCRKRIHSSIFFLFFFVFTFPAAPREKQKEENGIRNLENEDLRGGGGGGRGGGGKLATTGQRTMSTPPPFSGTDLLLFWPAGVINMRRNRNILTMYCDSASFFHPAAVVYQPSGIPITC